MSVIPATSRPRTCFASAGIQRKAALGFLGVVTGTVY